MSWRLGNENLKNSEIRNMPSLYREAGRASSWLPGAACTFSWSPTGISFYSAGQGKSETHPCSHPLRTSAQLSLLRTLTRVTFERLLCDGLKKKKKFPWRIILIITSYQKKHPFCPLAQRLPLYTIAQTSALGSCPASLSEPWRAAGGSLWCVPLISQFQLRYWKPSVCQGQGPTLTYLLWGHWRNF